MSNVHVVPTPALVDDPPIEVVLGGYDFDKEVTRTSNSAEKWSRHLKVRSGSISRHDDVVSIKKVCCKYLPDGAWESGCQLAVSSKLPMRPSVSVLGSVRNTIAQISTCFDRCALDNTNKPAAYRLKTVAPDHRATTIASYFVKKAIRYARLWLRPYRSFTGLRHQSAIAQPNLTCKSEINRIRMKRHASRPGAFASRAAHAPRMFTVLLKLITYNSL
ncbi:hypothetical protein EVAR_30379_1 [Eumeta japonica]|uniref:Uncharacterized protein n=1 Tax=Eumeta variegata TaxID=151549 RepID=A0A4C1W5Q9_EUMVA|nr:hypothetical protein EVAR_30379_1 [Eumeta japonica]